MKILHIESGLIMDVTHTEAETSASFAHKNNILKLEVLSASNNKRAKEIDIAVVKTISYDDGEVIKSDRVDYSITNPAEYSMFYNIPTVPTQGLGFTEYMHALNGATARCPELGANGLRIYNADGTVRDVFQVMEP